MEQLIQLIRRDPLHRFLLVDQTFFHHVNGNPNSRRAGTLAVAGLQHVQGAFFDGELKVLHVAIVLF